MLSFQQPSTYTQGSDCHTVDKLNNYGNIQGKKANKKERIACSN